MGRFSATRSLLFSAVFGVFSPSLDVYSDTSLMFSTVYYMGDDIYSLGCRACYSMSEEDVYDSKKVGHCSLCASNGDKSPNYGGLYCGRYPSAMKGILERNNKCDREENFHLGASTSSILMPGECESGDACCITTKKYVNVTGKFDGDKRITWTLCRSTGTETCYGNGNIDFYTCSDYLHKGNFHSLVHSTLRQTQNNTQPRLTTDYKLHNVTMSGEYVWKKGECLFEDGCCARLFQPNKLDGDKRVTWVTCNKDSNDNELCVGAGNIDSNSCLDYIGKGNLFSLVGSTLLQQQNNTQPRFTTDYKLQNLTMFGESVWKIGECGFEDGCCARLVQNIKKTKWERCNAHPCLLHLNYIKMYSKNIYDLRTWKVNNDYIKGVKIGGMECRIRKVFGSLISIPLFFHLICCVVVFISDVKSDKANMLEGCFLFIQFYTQWKVIKFSVQFLLGHTNEETFNRENAAFERDVGTLEAFVEATWQV